MTKETAMKILKELHDNSLFSNRIALETIIPELAYDNDERIRKDIIAYIKKANGEPYNILPSGSYCVLEMITWLSKQGDCSAKWEKNTPDNKPAINHSVLMKTTQGIVEGYFVGSLWFQFRWSSNIKDSDVLAWMELSDLDEQGKQKPTSDTRYKVKNSDSHRVVNGTPFDYENATITQNDFASVGETATIELSSPIDCGDRIYHVSHKPIEKNGEQKHINDTDEEVVEAVKDTSVLDMVEPKFKVGDWIASNICNSSDLLHIIDVDNKNYEIETPQGNTGVPSIAYIDNNFHLWTINDAKKGDVIFDKSDGTIGIFQSIGHHPNGGSFNDPSYCFLHCHYDDGFFYADFEDGNIMDSYDAIPATKEQCDLLFQEMKEAGYAFDFEKKELKKVEDEIEIPFGAKDSELQEETYYIPKGFHAEIDDDKVVIKKGEKSAAWNNEDEEKLQDCIGAILDANYYLYDKQEMEAWLKRIKDRIGG